MQEVGYTKLGLVSVQPYFPTCGNYAVQMTQLPIDCGLDRKWVVSLRPVLRSCFPL